MSDSLNKVLSKLVTSIEGVKNEREMLLRLIIGLAVFLLLAVFRKQISRVVVWLCTKTLARKSEITLNMANNKRLNVINIFTACG